MMKEKEEIISLFDPLPNNYWSLPIGKYNQNAFGNKKTKGVHGGIDITISSNKRGEEKSPLFSFEEGIVKDIVEPKYLICNHYKTLLQHNALIISGKNFNIFYVGLENINLDLEPGDQITKDTVLAYVNNGDIIHVEFSTLKNKTFPNKWLNNFSQPQTIIDPTNHMLDLKKDS